MDYFLSNMETVFNKPIAQPAQLMVIDTLFTAVAHMDYDSIAVNLEKSHESIRSHPVSGTTYQLGKKEPPA